MPEQVIKIKSKNRLYQRRRSKEVRVIKCHQKFRNNTAKNNWFIRFESDIILGIFLNFTNFKPHNS